VSGSPSVVECAELLGRESREVENAIAAVSRLLPPSLASIIDDGFAVSHLLFDEYVFRLALRVVIETKLDAALGTWATAADAIAQAGLDPRPGLVPVDWLLRQLAERGLLASADRDGARQFRLERALPAPDPAVVLAAQRRHDVRCLPSYTLADTAARDYPAFLRGERSGDEILLAPMRLPLWVGYFSNDNPLYLVNNRIGAAALEAWLPRGKTTILELGGGLASGAAAVLERLAAANRLDDLQRYRFTELVPAFLRRAERSLKEQFADVAALSFGSLDMNRPFAEQGVAPASVSVVYAVNTLHVAHDLGRTLGEVYQALAPGGQIVVSECIRPAAGQTLYPEFVFNMLETFRAPRLDPSFRPNGGFLTPSQWTRAFEAAGFVDVRVTPDIARIREVFPSFYVAAIAGRR
jgi:SAM-dependent methyltransferase